jgi:hypothetical protein
MYSVSRLRHVLTFQERRRTLMQSSSNAIIPNLSVTANGECGTRVATTTGSSGKACDRADLVSSGFVKNGQYATDAAGACAEMHPSAPKLRQNVPVAPFYAMKCSACGLCITDWRPFKTLVWMVIFGWWWRGEEHRG